MRCPFGTGIRISAALLLCAFGSGCASSQPLVPFTPSFPRNYLIVHSGQASEFRKADCIVLETVRDTDPGFDAAARLRELLRTQIPGLPLCRGKEPYMLVISEYRAGRGVCIDCGTSPKDPQSGFAFLSMTVDGRAEVATAEWEYWRGGTAQFMLEQFVFDLTNLWTYGISKFER